MMQMYAFSPTRKSMFHFRPRARPAGPFGQPPGPSEEPYRASRKNSWLLSIWDVLVTWPMSSRCHPKPWEEAIPSHHSNLEGHARRPVDVPDLRRGRRPGPRYVLQVGMLGWTCFIPRLGMGRPSLGTKRPKLPRSHDRCVANLPRLVFNYSCYQTPCTLFLAFSKCNGLVGLFGDISIVLTFPGPS